MALQLAVLGDSIGWGMGAARADDRLAPRLAAVLRDAGHDVETRVLAVPGARTSGLAAQVRAALARRPDVAVLVVGANDVTHGTPPATAGARTGEAVAALVSAGAEVVLAPAPDLSAVPHVPAVLREAVAAASAGIRRAQVESAFAAGGRVADVDGRTARAFAADRALFSADRFHPSSAGYAVIAAELAPVVLDAAAARQRAA